MKIGITERGDAGLDFAWYEKLKNHTVDGAILITKHITPNFIAKVMDLYRSGFTQIIVHCTCTGWGKSVLEPNVPSYHDQLKQLCDLIHCGFPISHCVLRIDPIVPTDDGIKCATNVLDKAYDIGLLPSIRVRISVLDEYKHVKERLKNLGYSTFYGDIFYAPYPMMQNLIKALNKYDLQFECCAEKYLNNQNQFVHIGCISDRDLRTMGLDNTVSGINPQNRSGCLCLSCKTELLTCRTRCPHQCVYCFWKD